MDPNDLEHLNDLLERDGELREKIREQVNELDKKARTLAGLLNRIHVTPSSSLPSLLEPASKEITNCQSIVAALAGLIPRNQYWKWCQMWINSLRSVIFSATLIAYLQDGSLIPLTKVEGLLGAKAEWKDRFTISAEDYLHSLITLVNELSRLAVNSVTMGEFERPIQISFFVKDIFTGFSLLNLKNDSLRKRFDGLKYDLKKVEEVVYDVSLRKLASPARPGNPTDTGN